MAKFVDDVLPLVPGKFVAGTMLMWISIASQKNTVPATCSKLSSLMLLVWVVKVQFN